MAGLAELGIEAKYCICDVTNREEVEAFADFAWGAFGRGGAFGHVDVIVNNAGIMLPPSPMVDTLEEDVQRIFAVNFYGVWSGASIFGKRFIEQGTPGSDLWMVGQAFATDRRIGRST